MARNAAFLNKSKFVSEPDDGKHDYEFTQSSDLVSIPSNLIPGLSGVSGGRVLLGDKAVLQAISLTHREAPLVRPTDQFNKSSFGFRLGEELVASRARHAGEVTHVTDDHIKLKDGDGKEHTHEMYTHHQLGRKTELHYTPQVKVGDNVKKGDLLASSNFSDKKGNLALGVNLNTAVMPFRSANFEDAFAVTESGAKKLMAEQLIRFRVDTRFGVETDKSKYVSIFPNKFTNTQLSVLDKDGVIKTGTTLHYGDPYVLSMTPKSLKTSDINLGKIAKALKHAYSDNTHTWDYEHPGKVIRVSKNSDQVTIQVSTDRPLQPGDKLSNAYGAKGVVQIIPDSQAPHGEDGKPVDAILNSMSITSRVAPALLTAIGLGKVALHTGKHKQILPFIKGSSVDATIAVLKKHGLSEQEEVYDPVSGSHFKATVGPLYINRLVHISEDKVSDRGQGRAYSLDEQPTKSEGDSAKRVGNLMTTALLSHGAEDVLRDIGLVKATKNDDYWRHIKLGLPPPVSKTPFIFDKFIATLRGAGINVDRKGDLFHVLPQTDKDIDALSKGSITGATTFKVKENTLIPEKGGLFDPARVGSLGENFNHIDLHHEIPNPISEDYLRKLLAVTKDKYEEMVVNGEAAKQLKGIDLDAAIKTQRDYLKSGKKTNRDNSFKLLSFLTTLKKNNIGLKDLIISKVPVIPAKFRPIAQMGDTTLTADVNHLYKELILINNALKNSAGLPEEKKDALRKAHYQAVKAIYGLDESTSSKLVDKNVKGLLASMLGIQGNSAKMSTYQSKVVNKPVDLVGRTVLVPDASLDMDQASVPQSILWKTYAPFVIRNLVKRGVPGIKATEYVTNKNPLAEQALMEEIAHRPAIITRDPQLHRYSAQGFYLKPNASEKDHTLKMNPLIFKGQGADADGDQLNIGVPASEEARKEVIEKMLPSRNILGPATFSPMYMPSNEASLGLFQLSSENNKNDAKKYKTDSDVVKAFEKGELGAGDRVVIG